MDQKTDIWQKYEAGKDQHHAVGMYNLVDRCHRFYEGDQWAGMKAGGEELPSLNFIKPICRYQYSTVALNDTAIIYSSMTAAPDVQSICDLLTGFARAQWEKGKMDAKKWALLKNACITGDHYLYVFDERAPSESVVQDLTPKLQMRLIDKDDVYLADEQESDLQRQRWIILAERRDVEELRRLAKNNGVAEEEIEKIVGDEEIETGAEPAREVRTTDKCTSLLYMALTQDDDGNPVLHYARSTRCCIWDKGDLKGMPVYPLAAMRWEDRHRSARGIGVVERLIPNQIEVNKTLARRSLVVKRYGYPTAVVDDQAVLNPSELAKVGSTLRVQNLSTRPITSLVQYLTPAPMGGDAAALEAEVLTQSRELEGAGEAATGQVDPTQASGEAIKAARDQSAMVLNDQAAAYKQFVEDLAAIWYWLWVVYSPFGLQVEYTDTDGRQVSAILDTQRLHDLDVDIKIDVSPTDPYSILSRQMALENALAQGHITFEEYVEALDADSGVPKAKLQAILDKRKAVAQTAPAVPQETPAAAQTTGIPAEAGGAAQPTGTEQLPPELMAALMGGGDANALSVV